MKSSSFLEVMKVQAKFESQQVNFFTLKIDTF